MIDMQDAVAKHELFEAVREIPEVVGVSGGMNGLEVLLEKDVPQLPDVGNFMGIKVTKRVIGPIEWHLVEEEKKEEDGGDTGEGG